MASNGPEKKAIKGGCHCGSITYTMHVTPNATGNLTATRCNCSFCQRLGATNLMLASAADFTLHTPSSRSELGDYAPRVKSVHRYFCQTCGAHVWMEGEYPIGEGKVMPICAVSVGTVDVPQEGVDLSKTEMKYFDMLHDNVAGGLKDEPWPDGLL